MKKWFQNLGNKIQTWMYGRYGFDELSKFLSVTALVMAFLSAFIPLLNPLALVLLIWSMIRTYSKNIEKRKKERNAYLRFTWKIKHFFKMKKNMIRDRKTHRYYKCPNCKAYLRVPKGRGEIEISCPKCKNKIMRKT